MQRCLGCMREFGEEFDVCPHCGYIVGTEAASKNYLAPGTTLQGRYTLGRVLGHGGFGVTYIAWDNKIGRAVAVKEYMPNALASRMTGEKEISCYNEEARKQFKLGLEKTRRETHALSQFGSLESVVKVHDCIEENGTAYIIMELLRGRTVKDVLKERGQLSFDETMHIMTPVLETLDAMHKAGMIHRDVAPDNIFVCEDGKIKLLDFGAARVISGTDEKTLSVMLKAGYAPVEQYSSKAKQGAYTDVYAASATMYRMLTGEAPPDSLDRVADDTLVPLGALCDLPPAAAEAIQKGMAVQASDRTQTAAELLEELQKAKHAAPAEPMPAKPKNAEPVVPEKKPAAKKKFMPKRLYMIIIAAVLIVGVIAGSVALAARHFRNKPDTGDQITHSAIGDVIPFSTIGDVITFGAYEQDNNTSNGKEEIEWIVLDKQDGKVLLISKYALDCERYDWDWTTVTWETCTLRKWLNGTFLKSAFNADEQSRIQTTKAAADKNTEYDTPPGNDTNDKVFLLSIPEAEKYFATDTARQCAPTAYVIAQGVYTDDDYMTADGEDACWWWLRSPGKDQDFAACVDRSGSVYGSGDFVSDNRPAVRPAMWINLES